MRADFYVGENLFWDLRHWPVSIPRVGSKITFEIQTNNSDNLILVAGKVLAVSDLGNSRTSIFMDMGEFAENLCNNRMRVMRWTREEPPQE